MCGGEARVLEQRTWVSWGRLGMVVRGMCGVSLRDGSAAVGIWCVGGRVRRVGLGWFRHVGRPILARMLDILCVFGVTDVKRL